MQTLDLRKELKHLYAPSAQKVEVVDVPELQFAMLDGAIEPGMEPGNPPAFAQAMEALYGISYTLKFMSKLRKENPIDYPVMALEGLWWIDSGQVSFERKDNWCWTVMMLQPDHITPAIFEDARTQLRTKRGDSPYDEAYMAGIVWKSMVESYDEKYHANSPVRNPQGPDSGNRRVMRGGAWNFGQEDVGGAVRWGFPPDHPGDGFGFRCARAP